MPPKRKPPGRRDNESTTANEEENENYENARDDFEPVLKDVFKELVEMKSWREEVNKKLESWSEMMSPSNTTESRIVDNEKDQTIQLLLDQMDELRNENAALKAQ